MTINTRKLGKNVVLKIKVEDKDRTNDGGYIGISKSEIYSILSARAKSGKATRLEQIAVYQQQYNNCAQAEALAKGETIHDADLMKLTDKQISGEEPLPDLAKKFPWIKDSAKDEFSAKCREELKGIERFDAKYDLFDDMNKGIIRDQFAMQRKASDAKQKIGDTTLDDRTERLVAAAAEKKATTKKTNNSQTYTPTSRDGVEMG